MHRQWTQQVGDVRALKMDLSEYECRPNSTVRKKTNCTTMQLWYVTLKKMRKLCVRLMIIMLATTIRESGD